MFNNCNYFLLSFVSLVQQLNLLMKLQLFKYIYYIKIYIIIFKLSEC